MLNDAPRPPSEIELRPLFACVNYVGGSIRCRREPEDEWANMSAENSVQMKQLYLTIIR
jgi:hypothetical protein